MSSKRNRGNRRKDLVRQTKSSMESSGPSELPLMCLNMIVKDEAHIINEAIESIAHRIDYYVIVDTGSTDDTVNIIKTSFKAKGVPGEVIEHNFRTCTCHPDDEAKNPETSYFNFGKNRTYALQQCAGKAQYLWVMDADDRVVGNIDMRAIVKAQNFDCYNLKFGKSFTWTRAQIIKNDPAIGWYYKSALHEYLESTRGGFTTGTIMGDYYIDARTLGNRSKNPNKYLDDALLLEKEYKKEKLARHAFYAGQSFFDAGCTEKAIEWYGERVSLGGWKEEVYYSYYRMGLAMSKLDYKWDEVASQYLRAIIVCPDRREAIYQLAKGCRMKGLYQEALRYYQIMLDINNPATYNLFVDCSITNDVITREMGICRFKAACS